MFYGFLAAWLIVCGYVISLARRGARLKKDLEDVKNLITTQATDSALEDRVR